MRPTPPRNPGPTAPTAPYRYHPTGQPPHLGWFTALVVCLVLLVGCGGGTRGTGDVRALSGAIVTETGAPLGGATITQVETGAAAVTDERGRFTLSLTPIDDAATIEIARGELTASTVIALDNPALTPSLPPVEITIDTLSGAVVSVEFEPLPDPTPPPPPQPGDPSPTPVPREGHLFTGTVSDTSTERRPAQGARIAIVGIAADTTDRAGRFSLRSDKPRRRVTFRVEYRGATGTFSVGGLPTTRPVTIRLQVAVAVQRNTISPGVGDPGPVLDTTVDSVSIVGGVTADMAGAD